MDYAFTYEDSIDGRAWGSYDCMAEIIVDGDDWSVGRIYARTFDGGDIEIPTSPNFNPYYRLGKEIRAWLEYDLAEAITEWLYERGELRSVDHNAEHRTHAGRL